MRGISRVLGAVVLLAIPAARAQAPAKVDTNALLKECMKLDVSVHDRVLSAIWTPYEMFQALVPQLAEGKDASIGDAQEELKPLEGYQPFMVRRETKDEEGTLRCLSSEELSRSTVLRIGSEPPVKPVPLAQVPEKTRKLLIQFKAGVEGASRGIEYQLLVFPCKDAKGGSKISAFKSGRISLEFSAVGGLPARVLTWRLPLESLVPATPCAKCKESLTASWAFCPWCGMASTPR